MWSVQLLTVNECISNPCRHGATCVDQYNGFLCQCTPSWQGPLCDEDVNECSTLAGTDLGCQNGATCLNTQGSFQSVLRFSCSIITRWRRLFLVLFLPFLSIMFLISNFNQSVNQSKRSFIQRPLKNSSQRRLLRVVTLKKPWLKGDLKPCLPLSLFFSSDGRSLHTLLCGWAEAAQTETHMNVGRPLSPWSADRSLPHMSLHS